MNQKTIHSAWDENNRDNMNHNYTELYGAVQDATGHITDEIYGEIRNDVKLVWREPVDTIDDLPEEADTGDTRMVRESVEGVSPVFRYDGTEWIEIQQVDSSAITEVDSRLQSEIDKKETPGGAQEKADEAKNSALSAVDNLEDRIYNASSEVVKVVESGSNANGEYIRYSDGMQYCWAEPFAQTATISAGGIFRGETREWTYPKPFASRPVSVTAQAQSYARWADVTGRPGTSSVTVYQYGYIEGTNPYTTAISAMGRWK